MRKHINKMLGLVCLTYTALLVIEALRIANTGQTPIFMVLCSFGMIFMIGGTAALTDFSANDTKNTVTLTLHLTGSIRDRLIKVVQMIGAENVVDVCREALKVYDVLVTLVTQDKAKVFIEYPDGKREQYTLLTPKSTDDTPSSPYRVTSTSVGKTHGEIITGAKISMNQGELIAEYPDGRRDVITTDKPADPVAPQIR
jgi:hypothetical protein